MKKLRKKSREMSWGSRRLKEDEGEVEEEVEGEKLEQLRDEELFSEDTKHYQ